MTTVLLEAFLSGALWFPATRRAAAGLGLVFHIAIVFSFPNSLGLTLFGAEMLAVYLLFLDQPRGSIESPSGQRSVDPGVLAEKFAH